MEQYISPRLTLIGSLAELTLIANGKGSVSADGKSGLVGNRSGH
jgi:hypothetical protein